MLIFTIKSSWQSHLRTTKNSIINKTRIKALYNWTCESVLWKHYIWHSTYRKPITEFRRSILFSVSGSDNPAYFSWLDSSNPLFQPISSFGIGSKYCCCHEGHSGFRAGSDSVRAKQSMELWDAAQDTGCQRTRFQDVLWIFQARNV